MKTFLERVACAVLAIAFPLLAAGQTNPQGWFCIGSTPGMYCSIPGTTGPFGGAISGCHQMATFWGEESFNGFACNVVKSHQEFWGIKLDWHEVIMAYSCGLGHQRVKDGCLTCPAGQERQADGTCGTPPLCVPPRVPGPSGCALPPGAVDPTKELGDTCGNMEGNPCNVGTGNKYQHEIDYTGPGPYPLRAERFYNSGPVESGTFSSKWRGFYDRSIRFVTDGIVSSATVKRADGKQYHFILSGSAWIGDADIVGTLERLTDPGGTPTSWRYVNEADELETYDAQGKLVLITNRAGLTQTLTYSCKTASATCPVVTPDLVAPVDGFLIAVTDPFGRQLNFRWEGTYVYEMIDPAGRSFGYTYNHLAPIARLSGAFYPDRTSTRYLYGEPAHVSTTPAPGVSYTNALTGKIDENGERFATWSYDAQGRVSSSEHGVGADNVTLTYRADGSTLVTDALGGSRTYRFETILGINSNTDLTRHDAVARVRTYDANRNVASLTDFSGHRTDYTYDLARNLETSRTEGLTAAGGTTPQTRTVTTQWHATHRLPAARAEPLRITRTSYDAGGNLLSRTVQPTSDTTGAQGFSAAPSGAPRTWTYAYNANGSVLTIDGPRTDIQDVTTYTYYANSDPSPGKRGNLASITNAAGHVTRVVAYSAHGQPLTIVDPNGLVTTMTYDARQRLTSRTVGSETTSYTYDNAGQLTTAALPDGSFLSYAYDSAHRLTAIQDNLGNRMVYSLDAMGNRTREEVRDPLGQLAQARGRVFDNLNRLFRELGAQGQTTEYTYDNHGNRLSMKDPLGRVTANQYDALNRLRQVTDPELGITRYGYNGLDALVEVNDPRNLATGYAVDGLGNLNIQATPDTGTTEVAPGI